MEEKWADIDGYDGYQVSNMGNIRSLKSMKILKQQEKENGLYDHLKKEVLKLDKEGNVLKNYESVSSVANDGYDPSFVSKVCRGDKSIAYGYIWRFK